MSDQANRLDTILDWLEQDKISTEDAAAQVRKMTFATTDTGSVWDQLSADAVGDLDPPEPDSFFPVAAAYSDGKITAEQYEALAEAAAETARAPEQ